MAHADIPRVIIRKKDRGEYIVNGLCGFWGITSNRLKRPSRNNPRHRDQKYIAIHILWEIADFKLKDIADIMGYAPNTAQTIGTIRQQIADRLSKINGDSELQKEYSQILKHLNL